MRGIVIYILFILFITVILPVTLVKGCDVIPNDGKIDRVKMEEGEVKKIEVYNIKTKKVEKIGFEEYIKGVVAAEMPAEFHIEALKAQAVAARTYAIGHLEKYSKGHKDHPQAPLCTGVHCQAWLSRDQLRSAHGEKWMYNYWPKIEEAVESTSKEVITYNDELIEPLFHSTSGGMTEDSENVFATAQPYLRSVTSPYEEGAPKLKSVKTMEVKDFINKIKQKYTDVNLSKNNLQYKIKAQKTESGRVKDIMIDNKLVSGRDIRSLFELNSTNFKIHLKDNNIVFETVGYGHGVGMSQWGANGMAKKGSKYQEILRHYYTGVEITKLEE